MLDVRCSASLNEPSHDLGRCQLFIGHEGPHALMFARDGARRVRTWHGVDITVTEDHIAGAEMQAWTRGFPYPAWIEGPGDARLPVTVTPAVTPAPRAAAG